MTIRPATLDDLPAIMDIIQYAQRYLAHLNIDQWQDGYPNEAAILNDISNQESFVVLAKNNHIIATFMLSTAEEPSYTTIDGQWLTDKHSRYGVIHRIAVAENATNKGVAKRIISHCEQKLKEQNIIAMRIDTHCDNLGMQHILRFLGYTYCGSITLANNEYRLAFEKQLI
ncbi:MAG: GNAT family N-acetyltransferase [Flavobacteriaceae bacterium]|nr:GNAT family N-acetyltransferase [Flavobacteriaceae bacterium]